MNRFVIAAFALLVCGAAPASVPLPVPDPMPASVPAPQDIRFGGAIRLEVDATDLAHHIFGVHEQIPVVKPGDMVLLYPQWIPGSHGPTGPIELLGGLVLHAGATQLAWTRDPVNMYAFHVDVPAGVQTLDADYQFLSPTGSEQGRVVMTPDMVDLQWNGVVLYPAGFFARDIPYTAALKLPLGWRLATALEQTGLEQAGLGGSGGVARFRTVPLDVLLDSPVLAGRHFARFDLDPGGAAPVHLNVVADTEAELRASQAQLAPHRALVQQAAKLFGAHHYDHYDFLLALSDELDGEGLEHHRSSEDAVGGGYFSMWDKTFYERDLLPHEYTHSWNGKYMRPRDLWTAEYNTPERDSLLWVYEGQTEYWGQVLAARSGLWSRQATLDDLALWAALDQAEIGRSWRTLEDTTDSPIFVRRRSLPWSTWQRGEDYYIEGELIWLDADTLIRERTKGRKSLDDVARAFFGGNDGYWGEQTYGFDDVVRALNTVLPYDWAGFLRERLDARGKGAPLDGITRGGYRLVFTDTKSDFEKSYEADERSDDFLFSIGVTLNKAKIVRVEWGSAADKAGVIQNDEILAVNGFVFDGADTLATAITDAKSSDQPILLTLRTGAHVHTVRVDDHDGLRYPHLVRDPKTPALLDQILAPR